MDQLANFFSKSKIFLSILISFILGIFAAPIFNLRNQTDWLIIVGIIFILLTLAYIFIHDKLLVILAFLGIFFFLAIAYYRWFEIKSTPFSLPYDKQVEFQGVIATEPDIRSDKIMLTIKVIGIDQGDNLQDNHLVDHKVLVNVPRYPEYQYGEELKISGKLIKPERIEDFDYGAYLSAKGVYALIINTTSVESIKSNQGNEFFRIIYAIKNHFVTIINKTFPEPTAALLCGLLLGMKRTFSENLINAFNIIGVTHIIAISGFNITIIVRAFERLVLSWPKSLAFSLGILILLAFVIMTGASASVTRAAIMASLFLLAKQLGRKGHIVIAATFVACIMIILNPYILRHDIGFQLSYLAILGLIYISPIFDRVFSKFPRLISEPLSATLGAQLATTPIILTNFGRFSIIAPLANLLILPAVPWAMLFGFISAFVGLASLSLGHFSAYFAWVFLHYIIIVTEILSKISWASIALNINSNLWVFIYYIILVIMIAIIYKKKQV